MTAVAPTWQAWLEIGCDGDGCPCQGAGHRLDLVLVRGLDTAGGPQRWHAMAPPEYHGHRVDGPLSLQTAGDVDTDRISIDWPVRVHFGRVHLVGAAPLRQTLS